MSGTKRIVAAAEARLASLRIVLRRSARPKSEYGSAFDDYRSLRASWERGEVDSLPNTDVESRELSIAEALRAALIAEFVLRRTIDGVAASRPVAVDALQLSTRISNALLALLGDQIDGNLPRKLQSPVYALAIASFDLSRCLVGYLVAHPAPDVTAGRMEPDAWLGIEETAAVRRQELDSVVRAHGIMVRFRRETPDGWRDAANAFAQRIAAVVQTASIEVVEPDVPARVREIGWLNPDELAAAKSLLDRAIAESDRDRQGSCLIGRALLSWVEDGKRPGQSLLAASTHLDGRNRISILCTLVGFVDDPAELQTIILEILHSADTGVAAEWLSKRAEALPQVLSALTKIAARSPERVPALARRVAGWPVDLRLDRDLLWLIPGFPSVGVLETADGHVTSTDLPDLYVTGLIDRLSNDHAEEFEADVDLGTLRQDLTRAMRPLRDQLASATNTVSYYAFGQLKHVPLGALTGRGAILAVRPGVRMFAPVPPQPTPPGNAVNERLYCLDRALPQVSRLYRSDRTRILDFDSRAKDTSSAEAAVTAATSSHAREILFFCHGHVDQFSVYNAGLIAATSDHGIPLVSSGSLAKCDLRTTDLAVVLACGAGQGNVFVEPSLSVGYAVRLAGAKVVIAPQWPILAVAALEFTNRFFALVDTGVEYSNAFAHVLAEDPNRFISLAYLEG
jgi:hypothetical protein